MENTEKIETQRKIRGKKERKETEEECMVIGLPFVKAFDGQLQRKHLKI
jgi:hypothetical protein